MLRNPVSPQHENKEEGNIGLLMTLLSCLDSVICIAWDGLD